MSRKLKPWIQTYTGKKFWLTSLTPESIDIIDIAHALSMQCRYAGHCEKFYSVAEHSVYVSRLLSERLQLAGLLHDASEAYLGDLTAPLKQVIGGVYLVMEGAITQVIAEKFSVDIEILDPSIKKADLAVARAEAEQILRHTPIDDWHLGLPECNVPIECWSPRQARGIFLARFRELKGSIPIN